MAALAGVVTLLKASSLQDLVSRPDALGETSDLGFLDQTMTTLLVPFSLFGASFWSVPWLEGSEAGAVL